MGFFNSIRYQKHVEEVERVRAHNAGVMGDKEETPIKEKLTQVCPDCNTVIDSDETQLKSNRLLREHRRLCEAYPYSLVNNSRNLRSYASKQEHVTLPAKRKRDTDAITEMRAKNQSKFYGDTGSYLDFMTNLEQSKRSTNIN